MTQQLEAERRALLARKRAQQEERRRKAEDLERILHENQRKVCLLSRTASVGCCVKATLVHTSLSAMNQHCLAVCATMHVQAEASADCAIGGGGAEKGRDGAGAAGRQPGSGAAQVAEPGHPHS